jgi:ABC-2 type transport system permease protein
MRRLRTIIAVSKKDLIQLLRYPTWIIQTIIWPLIFPLLYILSALGFSGPERTGISAFQAAAGTDNYVGFIVIGTMAWMCVNLTMWNFGGYLREEQTRGTLEANWLCPINKFDFLIGGGVNSIILTFMFTVVSVIEYRFIYGIHFTGNVFEWLLMFLILYPAVYGLGMVFASLVLWAKEVNAAVNVARGTMMILCGITFPITVMPGWMQTIAKFIPFTYGIQAARQIMINGESLFDSRYNILMCLGLGAVLIILGRIVFKYVESRVKISGSLERF